MAFWDLDVSKVQLFSHALIYEMAENIVPVSLVCPLTEEDKGQTTLLVVSAETTVTQDGLTENTLPLDFHMSMTIHSQALLFCMRVAKLPF